MRKLQMVTMKEIYAILAVNREKSFVKAAARLHTTQANVSKIVGNFEKKMDIRFFVRTASGVVLTQQGQYVVLYAEIIEDMALKILELKDELNDTDSSALPDQIEKEEGGE